MWRQTQRVKGNNADTDRRIGRQLDTDYRRQIREEKKGLLEQTQTRGQEGREKDKETERQ